VSIYRNPRPLEPAVADVTRFDRVSAHGQPAPASAPTDPDPGAARYGHLRKAAPVESLLPLTVRWAAQLPEAVRPYALMRQYPRVANLLAAAATTRASLNGCLADLLIDRRGGRRGFPEEVAQDLLRLRTYLERAPSDPGKGVPG
jgi:hypothetical protein